MINNVQKLFISIGDVSYIAYFAFSQDLLNYQSLPPNQRRAFNRIQSINTAQFAFNLLQQDHPNPLELFGNSTAELNCFVDSVLESSCTEMYTPVLRSESPRISSSAASFRRGPLSSIFHVSRGVFEQPLLHHPHFDLSLAHKKSASVACIYPKELVVGIDLEEVKSNTLLLQRSSLFSDSERDMLKPNLFLHAFAAKEALSKALKSGLRVAQSIYQIDSVQFLDSTTRFTFTNFKQYQALVFPYLEKYLVAIALHKKAKVQYQD